MKFFLLSSILLFSIVITSFINQVDYAAYFKIVKRERIDVCGIKNGYSVEWKNTSNMVLTIQMAIATTKGKWEVGTNTYIKPGETASFFACYPTSDNQVKWWAKPSDRSDIKFPTAQEILEHFPI